MTQPEPQPIPFDAFHSKIEAGVNLIEASAGTGKTFSIAMLVLRFIVEHKLPIEKILVVTFTKSATQELRTRIRLRLQDLKRFIVDPDHPANAQQDPAFIQWASQLDNPKQVVERVAAALASIDQAAIFTIHSFCQRMLRQYALESGQLFDAELSADIEHLKTALAEDYWRQQLYQADALKTSICTAKYQSPAALLNSIRELKQGMAIYPTDLALDDTLASIHRQIEALRDFDQSTLQPLAQAIEDNDAPFKATFVEAFAEARQAVAAWLADPVSAAPVSSLRLFSFNALMTGALNGHKFRKTKQLSGEARKSEYLADLGIQETVALDGLLESLGQVAMAFRLGLLDYLASHLQHRQSVEKVLSFDDLIVRLSQVLAAEGGELLRAALQRQFAVALIDEFQDTDQQQWHIFSEVYHTDTHYLYLIGDPKQAIYKFRGADIYSYLAAKRTARQAYTLETNYRSHPNLVRAVNQLFSGVENPFKIAEIPYYEVKAGRSGDGLWLNQQSAHAMVLWSLQANEHHKEGYWTSGVARQAVRVQVINEIVRLLDQHSGATTGQQACAKRLQPQDIAILVRGNEEAAIYQHGLQAAGIPAVLNSKQSVFDSEEAHHLLHLLYALLQPVDLERVRQALTLPWFGLDGQAFDAVCRDDMSLQEYVSDFQAYQQRWQRDGLMAMMRRLMARHKVLENLSQCDQPERRITNINHLLELVQQAVSDGQLDQLKTLQWLNQALQGEHRGDGQELRLEQDEAAVNVVTIHSAKGLEYPIVFCPDLWAARKSSAAPSADQVVICHEDNALVADLGSSQRQVRFEQARLEQLAEDLRLLYVAVTRAAQRCYLVWATTANAADTALGYLIEPYAPDAGWNEKFMALAQECDCFESAEISAEVDVETANLSTSTNQPLQAVQQQRDIRQHWQMSSYSALAYLSHQSQYHELPVDKSQEPATPQDTWSALDLPIMAEANAPDAPDYQLPKGAHTGNVLHDLLENHSFSLLKEMRHNTAFYEQYQKDRERSCMRYGLSLDEVGQSALDELLQRSVTAPLDSYDGDFILANLDDKACLKEMPFYFAMNDLQTQRLNQLLADQASCQPLLPRELSGQLTGFIDLICEYNGQYYVMDYKSNALEQYDQATMEQAMREHNYGLQYFLYSVVLHHYLQQRLMDYDYARHFGGVRYLFLRGMDPAQVMQGVFVDKPPLHILEGISDVLSGVAA
ncbi:MAG: exodeoxyribonuclease V subunit beta [Proteobacteria bacterium]|nr:MAG: exodeoxyribonuclease V subunit beta [Pseudomonadota bacterium]